MRCVLAVFQKGEGEGEGAGEAKSEAAEEEEDVPITWKSKIEEFVSMGFDERHVLKALKVLKGPDDSDAVVDWLFSNPYEPPVEEPKAAPKSEAKAEEEPKKKRRKPRKILIELQKLFANLKLSTRRAVSTKGLTDSFGWGGSQRFEQHDVHELNRFRLYSHPRFLLFPLSFESNA